MRTTETIHRTTRFDARLPIEQKLFFEKAVQIGGYRSLTEFFISTAMEKAEAIIARNEKIIASQRDSEIFFNAIMQQVAPNKELQKASEEYLQLLAK
jgi:uncharacterized protein (DUF1778 family)